MMLSKYLGSFHLKCTVPMYLPYLMPGVSDLIARLPQGTTPLPGASRALVLIGVSLKMRDRTVLSE